MRPIQRLIESFSYDLLGKPRFPQLPVCMLLHRNVGLNSGLNTAGNMEEGRHDRVESELAASGW